MPPVPVAPIGTVVVPIPVRSPVISWSIVSWAIVIARIVPGAIINGTRNTHGNMNCCFRFADRENSPDENHRENKEELSHNCKITFIDEAN
jgi:hypothetical protein